MTASCDVRHGICCAGNWIVDHVKTVDAWPAEETLANIVAEDHGTGGSPYNVCINLARFGAKSKQRVRRDDRSARRDTLDHPELEAAARALLDRGVAELVVVHAPEGALAVRRGEEPIWRPSLALPEGFIKGGAGAGDAFFAGMLLGMHEGWDLTRSLAFAHGAAASCLRHPTCTEGVGNAEEIRQLCTSISWRE